MSETVYACDLDRVWVWEHGHVPRDKMRGKALSERPNWEADVEVEQVLRGKVRHGWVITVEGGDWSSCSADWTTWFQTEKPNVVDGVWVGGQAQRYDADTDEERDCTVIDGPHEATWLEMEG